MVIDPSRDLLTEYSLNRSSVPSHLRSAILTEDLYTAHSVAVQQQQHSAPLSLTQDLPRSWFLLSPPSPTKTNLDRSARCPKLAMARVLSVGVGAPRARRRLLLILILALAAYLTLSIFNKHSLRRYRIIPSALDASSFFSQYSHDNAQHVLTGSDQQQQVLSNATTSSSHLGAGSRYRPAPGFEDSLPNCRISDLINDPLTKEYGQNNIRLSRSYEGTGQRVRRVLLKALRGEPIRIAVLGGSVSSVGGIACMGRCRGIIARQREAS